MLRPLPTVLLAVAVTVLARPATAERLITSLSNHRVMVTSSFTGSEVVLFGGIELESGALPLRGNYDVVVTVTGPRQTVVTFRKERVLGIWVNYESRVFENAPAYLAVLTNRPLAAITDPDTLRRLQLGLDYIALPQRVEAVAGSDATGDMFRQAFLKLKDEHGLYRQEPNGVTFFAPALFRASIPLPAEAPIGTYEVETRLFSDGALIARAPSALEIFKAGFEQFVTSSAQNHGLLYGLSASAMALLTGWFASVVFRRD